MTAFKTFLLFLMLMPAFLAAQDIKGFIYENPGNKPVANANILIPGTNLGTVSGSDGSFFLHIKKSGQVNFCELFICQRQFIFQHGHRINNTGFVS